MKGKISHLDKWLEVIPLQERIQAVFVTELDVGTQSTADLR